MKSVNFLDRNAALSPFDLTQSEAYEYWRAEKLQSYPTNIRDLFIELNALDEICVQDRQRLLTICSKTNLVFYRVKKPTTKTQLKDFAMLLGLFTLDDNLCADNEGVSSITIHADSRLHDGYIPYTNKALRWHTDGYYNLENRAISAILMHCVRPAQSGGANQYFDPEILYILLRDENPDFVSALMAPDAFTIPANIVDGKNIRAAFTGAVFSIQADGHLHMRFSARKHNIIWKTDSVLKRAVLRIAEVLGQDQDKNAPYRFVYTLQAGEGVISNNCLHNRSAFQDDVDLDRMRLLYRARFYERVAS